VGLQKIGALQELRPVRWGGKRCLARRDERSALIGKTGDAPGGSARHSHRGARSWSPLRKIGSCALRQGAGAPAPALCVVRPALGSSLGENPPQENLMTHHRPDRSFLASASDSLLSALQKAMHSELLSQDERVEIAILKFQTAKRLWTAARIERARAS
jgi:hypothetical protein